VVSFGKLSDLLVHLLEVLTDAEENLWIKPFFIDDLMVGRILGKISETAKVRLYNNHTLLDKLKDTIGEIRNIQKERNKVVHGDWLIDSTGRSPTKLRSYRLRWEDNCWQYLDDVVMTPKKVKDLSIKSKKLAVDLKDITLKIKAEQKQ